MPNLQTNQVLTGSARTIVILNDEGQRVVGRGSNFTWREEYELYPVDEYGVNGVNEIAQGRMKAGTGSIATYYIYDQQNELPSRASFLHQTFTILEVSTEDDNKVLNLFKGVRFSSVGGEAGSTDVYKVNAEVMYTDRLKPSELEDAQQSYPLSAG